MHAGPNRVMSMNILAAVHDPDWFNASVTDEEGKAVTEPMQAMYWQAQAMAYRPAIQQVIRPMGHLDPELVGFAKDRIRAVAESAMLLCSLARRSFVPTVLGLMQA